MDTKPTEKVRLWGFSDTIQDSVKSKLFGEMLNRSITERYRSDFYHDALWIEKHVTGPMTFFWVTREWGTHIGADETLVKVANADGFVLYKVDLTVENGNWYATFTELERL